MASLSRSRPTTPIRRVSRGSISSHHRASVSNANSTSTHLSFLTQAMSDLSYETSTLHSNLECIEEIDQALLTFDESFSMFLYGLRMNAFCVEWPEAPGEVNFERFIERRDQLRGFEKESFRRSSVGQQSAGGYGDETVTAEGGTGPTGDQTYMTQDDDDDANILQQNHIKSSDAAAASSAKSPLKSALKKTSIDTSSASSTKATKTTAGSGPAKGRITVAEKKRRESKAAEIIDSLPLEYRGSDPKPGQLATSVLLALMAAGKKGVRINEIVKVPELPQAKINKCMIALVTAKHVIKRSENGVVYQLDAARHGPLN